ncbi:MFS transporter [Streptomyces rectiverticillatus]|uniref:MFS transporter n=1 Tax=Streptomyces rectiverticillatus TaxID=173860 RepID=UPI0015C40C0E|nr:MFS transporter [Streptomyces rectiverticillatus]QLE71447.1 MFS transporter [Streptomyces rectiverticillatus]
MTAVPESPESAPSGLSTEPGREAAPPDRAAVQRRTVNVLMAAQIFIGVGMGAVISSGSLLVERLTGSQAAAGFATTLVTLGAAALSVPLAALSRSRGRRAGLGTGALIAAAGSLVVLVAAPLGWVPLAFLGLLLVGAGTAANLQSRFAATDLAEAGGRARALSLVVWSVTVGAVLGPNLTGPGAALARAPGLPEEAGAFVFSCVAYLLGWALIHTRLRPDPMLLAARLNPGGTTERGARFLTRMSGALRHVAASPSALTGLIALVLGHAVMVSVMTMTPVHLAHHGASLSVVGFTISLHIAGMYAFSPLVGRAADRFGRVPVILAGQVVYVAATLLAGTAGDRRWAVTAGLFLLGVGWSCATVAASTLLSESVDAGHRAEVQGASDMLMGLVGAAGGALSGAFVAVSGYGGLNAAAAVLVLPVSGCALYFGLRKR